MVDDILSSYAKVRADGLAWIDEQQMIEVDRIMIEDLRIELLQMMENAGRNLARLVLDGWSPRRVAVAAGSGGNGGGGMVAAPWWFPLTRRAGSTSRPGRTRGQWSWLTRR